MGNTSSVVISMCFRPWQCSPNVYFTFVEIQQVCPRILTVFHILGIYVDIVSLVRFELFITGDIDWSVSAHLAISYCLS